MDPNTLFLAVAAVGLAAALLPSWLNRRELELQALELQALELQVLLAEERQRAALPAHVDPTDVSAIEAWKRARLRAPTR